MAKRKILSLVSIVTLSLAPIAVLTLSPPASAADTAAGTVPSSNHVPGEKLDSGLGELPPYRPPENPMLGQVPGEKLDSGLGELPNYYLVASPTRGPELEKIAERTPR